MKKIKIATEHEYRVKKVIILVVSLVFMVAAITFGIVNFVVDCAAFGVFGTIFATIAIGLIPFFVHVNDSYLHLKKIDREIKADTLKDLKHFSEIVSNPKNSFVSSVLTAFVNYYGLNRFQSVFLKNDKRMVANNIENAIIAINPNWQAQLLMLINSYWYLLPNDDLMKNSGITPVQKLDLFIDYLFFFLNELEIIAYNFINFRTNKEQYVREEQKILERTYFKSYFILIKTNSNTSYENIEIACDIMN